MGTIDPPLDHLKEAALRNRSRITVLASAEHIEGLDKGDHSKLFAEMRLVALDPGTAVPLNLLDDTSLLLIEVDPANRGSMQRLGEIRQQRPKIVLIAAIRDANISLARTLLKQGIADVVSLPFDLDEVLQITLDAAAKEEPAVGRASGLASLISVTRSIGGCGATSIATHLAACLAGQNPAGKGVVIVDLDLQFGSVADYLGITPRGSLPDLLNAKERLDPELLRSVTGRPINGVSVIAAPEAIMPLEAVDTDHLLNLIHFLRGEFDHVVLDLPADWTNWALSAALASDVILLIVELSVASLHQAKRRLELFRSVGIDAEAVQIVVNRVERRLFRTIDLSDVSNTLGHSVLASVALEEPLVTTAQDQGQLVGDVRRKSRFAADIARIGELLRDGPLARRN